MIPQRVKLSGFLSYKEEQEIRFDEAPLWMLSGTNGSGKSSIFDAVTFALFGHHRGGSQSATELINKESNTLAVEFDFTVEKVLYRIRRTVRRRASGVASTQQVLRAIPGASAAVTPSSSPAAVSLDEHWEPIPDTQLRARFDAWIRDKIGLDYETFTSSVLLLQGKSEKLLDSTPAGRAGVLARIVDLERYQKLHGKADEKRREWKGTLEGLANQLAGLREVADEELVEAATRIERAEQARIAGQSQIDHLQGIELQARNWTDKQKTLAATRQKLANAESLLGTALAIEKDHARLRELKDVLPAITTIVTERGRVGDSERRTERLTKDRDSSAERRRQTDNNLEQSRKKLLSLKKTLADNESKQATIGTRLRELSAILEKVRHVEDAEAEEKRLSDDLKQLPPNPEATARTLQEEQERLVVLAQAMSLLERLHTDRTELVKVTTRQQTIRTDEARLRSEGGKAREQADKLKAELKAAKEHRERADQAAAEARALAQQARQLADEFQLLSGTKTCRTCGQELTAKHLDAERKKREQEAKDAERIAQERAHTAAEARQLEDDRTHQETEARERLEKLREQYNENLSESKVCTSEISRYVASCRQTYIGLPEEYKNRVGLTIPDDWLKVTYPERHDLTELHSEAGRIDTVRRRLQDAQTTANKARTLAAQLESARDRLAKARQGVPSGNPQLLRQEFAAKQAEETSIIALVKATKKEILQTETEVDRHQRALGELDRELTEIAGKFETEEVSRKLAHEAIERAKRQLPASWQKLVETAGFNERICLQDELDALTTRGTEAKFTQLQAARGGLDSLRAEIVALEEEAAAFPEEAHRSPEEIREQLIHLRKDLDARNRELIEAQRHKNTLDDYRRQRAELADRYKAADLEHNRSKLLAELLGRDRLQRHLVRRAERQIVDYANAVLDRLSGGQLFLRLIEAETGSDKALDLECSNRVTGGSAINVAFLSGSQRFRVAVALALGIGQYASKQHRPIESVIIDEGFGCLDRAGRQVMIQELQNLRGHLHCILLVSHQEEFASAFPDGYRFELENGSTRVSRFIR